MESKISEANSHIVIFGLREVSLMAISFIDLIDKNSYSHGAALKIISPFSLLNLLLGSPFILTFCRSVERTEISAEAFPGTSS